MKTTTTTTTTTTKTQPFIEENEDGTYNIKNMLFYLNNKRQIGVKWAYFLYVSIVEVAIVTLMTIFNFLGKVPTADYSFTVLFHVGHLFSWAAVFACLSKNFNYSFYKATMLLYGFMVILDLIAFVWRMLSTFLCNSSQCSDNFVYGIVGASLSLILLLWDIVAFIGISAVLRNVLTFVSMKMDQSAAILDTMAVKEDESNENSLSKRHILENYLKLITRPPSNTEFERRFILVVAVLVEMIFFFALVAIMMIGLVVNDRFFWSIFLNFIHCFSWMFMASCIYNNYSKKFFRGTMILYVCNLVFDVGAFVWRATELSLCNPSTNVDCIFRRVPGWFPIELFTGVLILADVVLIFTLSYFYQWLLLKVWTPAEMAERLIIQAKNKAIINESYEKNQSPPPLPARDFDQMEVPIKRRKTVNQNNNNRVFFVNNGWENN